MEILRKLLVAALLFCGAGVLGFGSGRAQTAGGKPTLTLGIPPDQMITDYKNNYFTKYMENYHNINIEFDFLPSTDPLIKVSLMAAANEGPDILGGIQPTPEAIFDYGSKGYFIPLNKYFNDPAKTPNWSKIPEEHRSAMQMVMASPDRNIYGTAEWLYNPWNQSPYRYYINQEWLDRLGLKMPATTSELRNVLVAFRDRDPNGNGRKDEIGVYGFDGPYGNNPVIALINSFIFYLPDSLALDSTGNAVTAPWTDSAFRKGLQYINGLYKDGLLSASIFTDDLQQYTATLNAEPAVAGLTTSGSYGIWPNASTNPKYEALSFIAPFKGPDGVQYTPYTPYTPIMKTFITSKAKDPDLAFKFVESFFNVEIGLSEYFGEEGVDWTRDPALFENMSNSFVSAGVADRISMVALVDNYFSPNARTWRGCPIARYIPNEYVTGEGRSEEDPSSKAFKVEGLHFLMYDHLRPAHLLPRLQYTLEDSLRISQVITDVNTYVKQSIAEFVTSARDINSDAVWNAYLAELRNMGLDQWITAAQSAYNRQKGR
jgi:putative aldouronate transport system substrate-binding protein